MSTQAFGLLGGSFDPVHNGHIAISQSFLDSGYIDKLYIILSPDPPHKADRNFADFEHRFNMLKLAFDNPKNLLISKIENKLSKPSYTINTIEYFAEKYPDRELYLCIGEDSYNDFTNWHKWEEIVKRCTLLVAKRPDSGINAELPALLKAKAKFISHDPVDISSSSIREMIGEEEDVKEFLPEEVYSYIQGHQLYRN